MTNQYNIDLAAVTIEKFKENIRTRDLIPSRVSLKDDLDGRFEIIASVGITNMNELVNALKTRSKIYVFAKESGLPAEYLTLLCREARSYLSNPVRLDKFPGIPSEYVDRLEAEGIKNTRQMLICAGRKSLRINLALRAEIPIQFIDELASLSDLSRAYGIGPVFARMLYGVGIHSIKKYIQFSAEEIIKIYEEKEGKKADFGENEIQFSLNLAKDLNILLEV